MKNNITYMILTLLKIDYYAVLLYQSQSLPLLRLSGHLFGWQVDVPHYPTTFFNVN